MTNCNLTLKTVSIESTTDGLNQVSALHLFFDSQFHSDKLPVNNIL